MNIERFAESINQLRIVPRLGLLYLFYITGQTYSWYYELIVPSVEQTAVVGGVSALLAGGYNFYVKTGGIK